jgi:hypothetical protein
LLVIAAALASGFAMKGIARAAIRQETATASGALLFALGSFWFFSRLAASTRLPFVDKGCRFIAAYRKDFLSSH